jgi:hypothetical protein
MAITKKIEVPLTGLIGVGTGASIGTLAGEYTSRAIGQTAWNACAVKAGVKGVIGFLGYAVSTKLGGPLSSFFAEMFAYGSWGSIFFDIALAAYPGGIPGLAEDWAVTTRVYAAGGRRVASTLTRIETGAVRTAPTAVSAAKVR